MASEKRSRVTQDQFWKIGGLIHGVLSEQEKNDPDRILTQQEITDKVNARLPEEQRVSVFTVAKVMKSGYAWERYLEFNEKKNVAQKERLRKRAEEAHAAESAGEEVPAAVDTEAGEDAAVAMPASVQMEMEILQGTESGPLFDIAGAFASIGDAITALQVQMESLLTVKEARVTTDSGVRVYPAMSIAEKTSRFCAALGAIRKDVTEAMAGILQAIREAQQAQAETNELLRRLTDAWQ